MSVLGGISLRFIGACLEPVKRLNRLLLYNLKGATVR